jgi:hypothetical protein
MEDILKQRTVLEIVGDRKSYRFECDPDSPLGEIHDSLSQMKHYIVQRIIAAQQTEIETKNPVEAKEVADV